MTNTHIKVIYAEDYVSRNPNSFYLDPVEQKEISDIVNNCKNKTSTDWSRIDMPLIKKVIDCIVIPLTHICNIYFSTGLFPQKMKTAKVIPLFKAGDKLNFNNYRPVSLLCPFSKILEKLFIARLDKFIEKHKLLTDSQYGLRANRSTA